MPDPVDSKDVRELAERLQQLHDDCGLTAPLAAVNVLDAYAALLDALPTLAEVDGIINEAGRNKGEVTYYMGELGKLSGWLRSHSKDVAPPPERRE